jgi:predicted secreted protein
MHKFSRSGTCVVLLAGAVLAGCGQQQEPPAAPPAAAPPAAETAAPRGAPETTRSTATITLTEADEGRALTLQRGQVVEVRLTADRLAGFTWIPAQNALPVLATDGVPLYEKEEGAAERDPGIEVWRFIGRAPGHAHIVFEYRRPFEPDAPPQQSITFHFDVE